MDSFFENLENGVQCTLCKDTLIEPKILPCSDTFCKLCIKRHAELIEEVNVFKCPRCTTVTYLPGLDSVEFLKPSVQHSRKLEFLKFLKGENVCSVCEKKPEATWYCLDRQRLLCKDCAKTNSIINKEQQNISSAEVTEADIKRFLKRENLCEDHGQVYEFFCKDCEKFICIYCFRSRQCQAHETVSIAEAADHLKDLLVKKGQEKLKAKQDEIQKNVEKFKEIASTKKEDGERAKAEIEETVKQLIEMLQKCKQELHEHINQKIEEADRKLKKEQEELVRIGWEADYIHELKNIGVVSEIPKATQNIEVNDHSAAQNVYNDDSRFKFAVSHEYFRFLNSKNKLGSLEQVDMTKTIHVEPELEALKKVKLTLTANETSLEKNEAGSACTSVGDKSSLENESKEGEKHNQNSGKKDETPEETNQISATKNAAEKLDVSSGQDYVYHVKISPEENVEIKENNATTDGKTEVEFMPKVAGQLRVEVQVNGNHVSNSPLVMNVKPQKMKITGEFNTKRLTRENEPLCRFADIAVNESTSRIAVTDWCTHSVHVCNTNGDLLLPSYNGEGSSYGPLRYPQGLAFLNETDLVIADCDNHRICIVNTTTGTLVKTFGNHGSGKGEFKEPHGVHVDEEGNIIVCDYDNHRVKVITRDGVYQYEFCLEKVDHFSPIGVQKFHDRFYVSDYSNHVIHVFEKKGSVVTRISTIGGEGSGDGELRGPCGLAIDNDHHLVVCDRGNNRIQKFTLDGRLVGKTCDEIDKPHELAVGKDGILATTDSKDSKILIVK